MLDPPLFLALAHEARDGWTVTEELLANQVELLAAIVQMLAGVFGGFKPLRLPRPGEHAATSESPNRVVIRPSEMAAALGARKRGVS